MQNTGSLFQCEYRISIALRAMPWNCTNLRANQLVDTQLKIMKCSSRTRWRNLELELYEQVKLWFFATAMLKGSNHKVVSVRWSWEYLHSPTAWSTSRRSRLQVWRLLGTRLVRVRYKSGRLPLLVSYKSGVYLAHDSLESATSQAVSRWAAPCLLLQVRRLLGARLVRVGYKSGRLPPGRSLSPPTSPASAWRATRATPSGSSSSSRRPRHRASVWAGPSARRPGPSCRPSLAMTCANITPQLWLNLLIIYIDSYFLEYPFEIPIQNNVNFFLIIFHNYHNDHAWLVAKPMAATHGTFVLHTRDRTIWLLLTSSVCCPSRWRMATSSPASPSSASAAPGSSSPDTYVHRQL